MAFVALNDVLGEVDLTIADPDGPGFKNLVAGTGSGRQNFYGQTVVGVDPVLGAGEFMYMKLVGSGSGTPGNWCTIQYSIVAGQVTLSAATWAGTANTGQPLCVAVASGTLGQWAWFQVGGIAIATTSGAPSAGNAMYWASNNTVSPTVVASKQVLNAQYVSAAGATVGSGTSAVTLGAGQALAFVNRPFSQGAIT